MSKSTLAYPDKNSIYPIPDVTRTCFLKNIISHPQIIIGDDTYYDDPDDIHHFKKRVSRYAHEKFRPSYPRNLFASRNYY